MPTEPVILRGESTTPLHRLRAGELVRLWPLLFVAGAILTLDGWIDVLMLWIPVRLSGVDWTFQTINRTVGQLPQCTVGLTLLASALLARGGKPWPTQAMAGVFAVLTVVAILCVVLYAIELPPRIRLVMHDPASVPGMKRLLFKTSLLLVAYTIAYGACAAVLFREVRESDPLR